MIERGEMMFLLLLLIPLWFLSFRRYRAARMSVAAIVGDASREASNLFLVRWFFGTLLFLSSLAGIVAAAAGLRWGTDPPGPPPSDLEVVFVFDVSRSMLAQDVTPSRLERSVAVALTIVTRGRPVPYGIVVFKGSGHLLLPVTSDTAAIESYLAEVDTSLLSYPGTDISAGIRRAFDSFPLSTEARRAVVLFSDGGNLEGRPIAAAQELVESGISLLVVGAGREDRVPIPVDDGYLMDSEGKRVTSRLETETLEAIARAAGGSLLLLESREVVAEVTNLLDTSRPSPRRNDRYRVALLFSLSCLAIWACIRSARWKDYF